MKTAKSRAKQTDDRRTVEEARRAFSDSAEAITAAYVFRLRHAWEAVAVNLATIEALHRAGKSWDEIGAMLGPTCGFEKIAGQSVRVYRSRLKGDHYDAGLSRLGLRREGKALLPLAAEDERRSDDELDDHLPDAPAVAETETDKPVATVAIEPNRKIGASTPVLRDKNAGCSSPTSSAAARGRYPLKSHPE